MLFDKGEKLLLNRFKIKNGGGTNGIVDKAENILPDVPKKSTIAERIEKGEISTKINSGKQDHHIEGTKGYMDYYKQRLKNGRTPQNILTIDEKTVQELINKYAGTGTPKIPGGNEPIKTEYIDAPFVVGKFYRNNKYYDTKRFAIYYGKEGAHIVPAAPLEE